MAGWVFWLVRGVWLARGVWLTRGVWMALEVGPKSDSNGDHTLQCVLHHYNVFFMLDFCKAVFSPAVHRRRSPPRVRPFPHPRKHRAVVPIRLSF